jgi:glycine/D-amino acid oxidase-like deaminating enzyme
VGGAAGKHFVAEGPDRCEGRLPGGPRGANLPPVPAPPAPLAQGYRERPWWWEAAPPPPATGPRRLPGAVDVLVVGAGYTGLAAAREVAGRGRSALVVERDALGTGASTRNGGMAHPGAKRSLPDLLAEGPDGRALWDATVDGFLALERLVADEGIDCHYRRTGHVVLAHRAAAMDGLRASEKAHREVGDEVRLLARDELAEEVGTPAYEGGLVVGLSGGLHPARLFAGVLGLATAAGATVADRTAVTGVERRRGGGFTVRTSRGTVAAGDVLVATNATAATPPALVPWLARRVLAVGSFIVATEPLAPDAAAATIARDRMLFDTRNFLRYWRLAPDGRMLFGGRTSFARTTVARSRDRLYRAMVAVHPQLRGVRVTNAWGGLVGLTIDRQPHVGRVDGVAYAGGWCGSGVVLSNHVGALVGRWLAEGGPPPPFTGRRWPRVPAPGRSPWLLPVGGWYYRARDRFG